LIRLLDRWPFVAIGALTIASAIAIPVSSFGAASVGLAILAALVGRARFAIGHQHDVLFWLSLTGLAPLASASYLGVAAALVALAPLGLLDRALRADSQVVDERPFAPVTRRGLQILGVFGAELALGLIGGNTALALTGAFGVIWFLVIGLLAFRGLAAARADLSPGRGRVVLGGEITVEIAWPGIDALAGRWAPIVRISAFPPWLTVTPTRLAADRPRTIALRGTPPSAGPHLVDAHVDLIDSRGLTCLRTRRRILDAAVVPRAKYAVELAQRYLQGRTVISIGSTVLTQRADIQGVRQEFWANRPAQPGDSGRDIDWKRVAKYRSLIVREFRGPNERSLLLGVNLGTTSADEVDRLTHDLVLATITLADTPTIVTLVAYGTDAGATVIETSGADLVREALAIVSRIERSNGGARTLASPNLAALRRIASRADPLARLVDRQVAGIVERARMHPLSQAIDRLHAHGRVLGAIVILSNEQKDADALAWLRDRAAAVRATLQVFAPGQLRLVSLPGAGRPETTRRGGFNHNTAMNSSGVASRVRDVTGAIGRNP
jgi:uncharacterized protein (DUF58 family)